MLNLHKCVNRANEDRERNFASNVRGDAHIDVPSIINHQDKLQVQRHKKAVVFPSFSC